MTSIDPDLVRVWIRPGTPFTYEIDAAGGYHIGGPESPISFAEGGMVMTWGTETLDRQAGAGDTPEGRWIERGTGAEWHFAPDGCYEVLLDGETDVGIWALRAGGTMLWTRELRAQVATNGAEITFDARNGTLVTYGYTVGGGVWVLFDRVTWVEVMRYVDPASLPGM